MAMELIRIPSGFLVNFKGKTLLSHRPGHPLVKTGTGTGKVKSLSGFFKIKESSPVLKAPADFVILEETSVRIRVRFDVSLYMVLTLADGRLEAEFSSDDKNANRLMLFLPGRGGDRVYGGGEQYSRADLSGKRLPVWISEPGVGRRFDLFTLAFSLKTGHIPRWYYTYYSMPVWLTSDGFYGCSHSSAYTLLDFRRKKSSSLYFWEIPARITLGVEPSLKEALGGLSLLLGRQAPLPEWLYDGFILGAQGGRKVVEDKIARVRAAGVRLAGVWCQDWEGTRKTSFGKQLRWAWEADETLYPDLAEFIRQLKEEGIRYLGYNNTFLTPGSVMFDQAVEKGYLIKKEDGSVYTVDVPFDPAALVDFTNPRACLWLKDIIKKNMIDLGLSGWMADFGEMIPHDSCLFSGESGLTYHNRYPVDWARLNREAVAEAGKEKEIFTFMRAGYTGASRYTCSNWTGDQLVDWSRADGLPSAIMAGLTLGLSGVGYVHSDTGGYTTLMWKHRSRELLMRWAEFSAFTQTMRSHEGNRPWKNFQYGTGDSESLTHLARMTRIFAALKPYHRELSREYQEQGLPPMRIPGLHYPREASAFKRYPYEYLYGRDLLIAPVLKPGKTRWKVCLPRDNWVHLWSDREYSGGKVIVEAPLGSPPVFYRRSSDFASLFESLRSL